MKEPIGFIALAVSSTALILAGGHERREGRSAEEAAPNGTARETTGKAPPIPKASPLARPRSLQQVGLPTELTRAVVPPDNPQTPEKIALGQKLFFGSQETLWDVIDHYNKGDGLKDPYLDEDIQPLALKEDKIDDLVAFLASLTSSDYNKQGLKELARQRSLSRTNRPQRDTARAFGPKPVEPKPPRR
jgi:cytochrome c peroxidase